MSTSKKLFFFFLFLFFFDQDRDTRRDQAWDITFPIRLVCCPKLAFLIGYYNKKRLPQEFCIEQSDRKVERLLTKIQLHLFRYCKYPGRNIIVLRQNIHIGICNDAALEEAI